MVGGRGLLAPIGSARCARRQITGGVGRDESGVGDERHQPFVLGVVDGARLLDEHDGDVFAYTRCSRGLYSTSSDSR
jgi:hypothetical protein